MADKKERSERLSRRRLLTGLAAFAASGAVRGGELLAQAPAPRRRLDVHHHLFAPDAVKTFAANFDGGQPGPLRLEWTPEKSLEAMDRAGIDTALLSCNIPFGDDPGSALDEIRRVARDMNDLGAVRSDHKGRFGLLASLPLPTRESPATRCPDVTFIWSHAGGTLLGLIQRFLGATTAADVLAKPPAPNSRLYHLRRFYYDTAVSMNAIEMTALKSLVGASQIVFGSDFPFISPVDTIQGLRASGLSAEDLRGIEGENALRIFPRWTQV